MSPRPDNERAAVVQRMIDLLEPLDDAARARVLRTVATYFEISMTAHHYQSPVSHSTAAAAPSHRDPVFSGHEPISPKDFIKQKDPVTDVERAMCLAYYLAHYRDVPSFKTSDIAKLNTEAAQRKFANAAYTVNNAATTGYFVAAAGGHRQLSSMGEQYVEALPDRQAARSMMKEAAAKRRRSKGAKRR